MRKLETGGQPISVGGSGARAAARGARSGGLKTCDRLSYLPSITHIESKDCPTDSSSSHSKLLKSQIKWSTKPFKSETVIGTFA